MAVMSKKYFFRGTLLLTAAGILSRILGFFYRIFLSHTVGAEGIGLYQLVLPLQSLVLSLTAAGIQAALSRLVSSMLALGEHQKARGCFLTGTLISTGFSAITGFILYRCADFFAVEILKEASAAPLIRILCFSFPFAALHACVNSYCMADKKPGFPAAMQLVEQLVRIGSSWLIFQILLSGNQPVTASVAAAGGLVSELFSALISLIFISCMFQGNFFSSLHKINLAETLGDISVTALPMTVNRLFLTLLSAIEAVLLPQRLRIYGLTQPESLAVYGIFTGMALPLILFPSAVTNSASAMLMPSVAEMQAFGNHRQIRYVTRYTVNFCILLGVFSTAAFFIFGPFLGSFLFHSITAGSYLRAMAFICTFLYMNTALSGILHGLGRTGTCLLHSSLGILLRISFVLFTIPSVGIRGYFYGILFSEILVSILHIYALYRIKP